MKERMRESDSIEAIDARERKLRELTVGYLRGEISVEDYSRGCRENENRIDFRRIATWQINRAREIRNENRKKKIKNFARKVLNLPQNS